MQNARGVEESAAGIQEHRPTMDAHENIEMISFARHPERGRCSPTRVAATGALARHGRELRDDDEILTPARQHPGRHRDVHKRTGETREDLTAQGSRLPGDSRKIDSPCCAWWAVERRDRREAVISQHRRALPPTATGPALRPDYVRGVGWWSDYQLGGREGPASYRNSNRCQQSPDRPKVNPCS